MQVRGTRERVVLAAAPVLLALADGWETSRTTVVVEPPFWLTIAAVPPAARPADRSDAISTGTTMREPRPFLLWFSAAGGGVVE